MKLSKAFSCLLEENYSLPFYEAKVQAGFPSPADDHMPDGLDLNKYLIKRPAATFFIRVIGDSMTGAGIKANDLLVVDKSIKPVNNKIVIAVINNEFTVKRLKIIDNIAYLCPENDNYSVIKIDEEDYIWGVVTSVIHQFLFTCVLGIL